MTDQERSETQVSPNEKILKLTLSLGALSIAKLKEFASIQLNNGQIHSDRVEFSMSAPSEAPFKGHLELVRHRFLGPDESILDRDFDSKLLVGQSGREILMLKALGVNGLRSKRYTAKLRLSLDGTRLKEGAINPEALNSINATPLELQFEGKPE
jgi:hypothetical protein